jgi:RNA polymerase sigma-70 factor (ECF subfamily)
MTTLGELYRRYAPDVHRFVLWLSGDHHAADDITSETFVRAWAGAEDLRMETVKAYLIAIARNLYLRQRRRSGRHTELDEALVDPSPGPEARAERREEWLTVRRALERLPEVDRAALLMRAELELSYEEIARALGLSLSAAKVKVHRARLKMAAAREARGRIE